MVLSILNRMEGEHSLWGGTDGRLVQVLDSQPRDRGFEFRHTLGLLCLNSLGKT